MHTDIHTHTINGLHKYQLCHFNLNINCLISYASVLYLCVINTLYKSIANSLEKKKKISQGGQIQGGLILTFQKVLQTQDFLEG